MKQVEFFLFCFSDLLQKKKKKTEVEIKDNRYSALPPQKVFNQTKIWALT